GRVLDLLGPGHFGDVDHALDALLELDERAVVGEGDDFALDPRAHRVLDGGGGPGVGLQLLVAEAHPLGVAVALQHLHLDLVPDVQHFARVVDAAPRHVGDVQQSVDAAEVHEGAVLGDVLHRAHQDLALFEGLERVALLLRVLLFEDRLAREHDVAALLVDLDDAHAQLLAAQAVQVAHGAQVHLAAGQEGAHADVHGQPALHALDDAAGDDAALLVGALHVVPDLHLLGLLLGEDHVAFLVLRLLQEHVHGVPDLDVHLPRLVAELLDGDDALGLVADVDDHLGLGDLQDDALDD